MMFNFLSLGHKPWAFQRCLDPCKENKYACNLQRRIQYLYLWLRTSVHFNAKGSFRLVVMAPPTTVIFSDLGVYVYIKPYGMKEQVGSTWTTTAYTQPCTCFLNCVQNIMFSFIFYKHRPWEISLNEWH